MSHPLPDPLPPASPDKIRQVFAAQQAHAQAVRESTVEQRIDKLERLCNGLRSYRSQVQEALQADFSKAPVEVDLTEILPVLDEAYNAMNHLEKWMQPDRVGTPLLFTGTQSEVQYEPKGVVLILSPWNYPLPLTLGPLVAALAAGNCVVLKPSEYTPHTTAVLEALLSDLFEEQEVALLTGAQEVAQTLLDQPFDHVYFTGSTRVGRLVMKAAAEHPTSVTLELGGKSPAIVDATADLDLAAERIAWAKFTNAGQTCIAPDYLLVEDRIHDTLVERIASAIRQFYGATEQARRENGDYARLINSEHWQNVITLLEDALKAGAAPAIGGKVDADTHYLSPTILTDVPLNARIMQEEIFGPLLPVLRFRTEDEALQIVNDRPNPLSLYLFTERESTIDTVLRRTSAGSTCINETLLHFANPQLPFGGAGHSGIGRGHGKAGFRAFSNERSVMRRSYGAGLLRTFYPPYDGFTERIVSKVIQYLSGP